MKPENHPYGYPDDLSGSTDILKSYQLLANCYLTKPVELDQFEGLVKSINDFWLTRSLPQQEAN